MDNGLAGLSRRSVLGGLLVGAAGSAAWADTSPIRARSAANILQDAQLGGKTTFAVADARTGLFLEGHNQNDKMPPASVAKAVTALYALETLGPGYRFVTRLIATGPVQGGQIQGDLILAGTGDPTLLTDDLAALAAKLAAQGVSGVSGRFMVYDGALPYVREIDKSQPDHVGYNPSVSGLNLNFNRVHFEWKRAQRGYQVAMDARSDTLRPAVSIAQMRVADRNSPLYTYADRNGIDSWTVAGGALGRGGSRWLPVRKPGAYAGEVFQVLAGAHGIRLGTPQITQGARGTTLVEHASADLGAIITNMLKWSTNITAEAMGLASSSRLGNSPRSLRASGRRMSDWLSARIGVGGVRFVDHSGLGVDSQISADHMVRTLVHAGVGGPLHQRMKRITMKDQNGNRIRNHPAQVVAKTGTLNFVSALSGYVQTPSNAILAFTIFSANMAQRRGLRRDQAERPRGGRSWTRRARNMQLRLIERWASVYGS